MPKQQGFGSEILNITATFVVCFFLSEMIEPFNWRVCVWKSFFIPTEDEN